MAERGRETLRHGPMKPVGLTNPHNPSVKAYAVVQLRQDNALGTLYNMVGFQTKLKYAEQARVFRMIPGLEKAEFARLGGLHRNTYINSPVLLDRDAAAQGRCRGLRFAGQITGCEGYVEAPPSACWPGASPPPSGSAARSLPPPPTTAFGALLGHITGGHIVSDDEPGKRSFQPMNVNFGLFPPIEVPRDAGQAPARARKRRSPRSGAHVGPGARRSRCLACRAGRRSRRIGASPVKRPVAAGHLAVRNSPKTLKRRLPMLAGA